VAALRVTLLAVVGMSSAGVMSKMSQSAASTRRDSRSGVPGDQAMHLGCRQRDPPVGQGPDQFGGGENAVLGHDFPQPPSVADLAFHNGLPVRPAGRCNAPHRRLAHQ
jgi:hypothetical protein